MWFIEWSQYSIENIRTPRNICVHTLIYMYTHTHTQTHIYTGDVSDDVSTHQNVCVHTQICVHMLIYMYTHK